MTPTDYLSPPLEDPEYWQPEDERTDEREERRLERLLEAEETRQMNREDRYNP